MAAELENPTPSVLTESKTAPKSVHSQHSKTKNTGSAHVIHKNTKHIKLEEDFFGYFVDGFGKVHNIKRFTWINHNCIRAQVITYGARIISLRLPSRKHYIDDVVLGFDNMDGYLCNGDLHLGAIIGRVAGKIENGTCVINNKQHWLSVNDGSDHCDGGFKGLDKVVWVPNVQDSKVMLSYVSKDLDEGYPGDLFIRITFELSTKNEFTIDMEAFTTRHTIINLSNLLYFNLGGHGSGPEELCKHIVSINANCYLPLMDNGLPSGEILNVIYTKNDFQVPKLLKNEMGIEPDDGYDEHMCVNRGIDQGLCFVARALHPPSGRILEMYSNQCGVHFSTAKHFGYGVVNIPLSVTASKDQNELNRDDDVFQLIDKLHSHIADTLSMDSKCNYEELKDLIHKLHKMKSKEERSSTFSHPSAGHSTLNSVYSEKEDITLTPVQAKYLEGMMNATQRDTPTNYKELEEVIRSILDTVTIKDELEIHSKRHESVEIIKNEAEFKNDELEKQMEKSKSQADSILKKKGIIRMNNKMQCCCKDERIHGKNNAIYKRHGAMCFQSENYPNAIYHKNFPNCELRPGETYRHTIVYKFWIQSGDPNKWLRRNITLPRN
ncbi:hypothetical protein ILUMI_03697 [Ignelater luminosus]|uniref:Galactose mutarotase n=1 Tax=Ignelater luminosus TaxID=2038154 RepID=A0A8K0GJP6_IGNLU|nr:hypothetical protein ILUMI_03697 [Ignelater luminosus]